MAAEQWWLEHIWELCRPRGIPLERAHYVFGLSQEDIRRLDEIDKKRTMPSGNREEEPPF